MSHKTDSLKVLVAMSGGVDSSVAAALLNERGYQVTGVTMRIWDGQTRPVSGKDNTCFGPGEVANIETARRVARTLGITHHVIDLRQEYKDEVLDYFCHEYLSGRTPNPCPQCNRRVKFAAMPQKARENGIEFDHFATGHYARVECDEASHRYRLRKARDRAKDQSYFLSSLSQEQLSRSLFPIGGYTKVEVRGMAAGLGLDVASKPGSQDFIGSDYPPLAERARPGPIRDRAGNELGQHHGFQFCTIGQRHGLGIPAREALYVLEINPDENTVTVGSKAELYGDELIASRLNWIAIGKLEKPQIFKVKIRYRHQEASALVTPVSQDRLYVKFTEPQLAITPGQTLVLYTGDMVVGSGIIEKAGKAPARNK